MRDSNQNTARYNVAPFQKAVIELQDASVTKNWTVGQHFPQYEGEYLKVDRADYPMLVSFVNVATGITQTSAMFPGLVINAPFKGLYISGPSIPTGVGGPRIEFTIGKDSATIINDASSPCAALYPPTRINSDTAVGGNFDIYIPPGARYIAKLECAFTATTITLGDYSFLNLDGVARGNFPPIGVFNNSGNSNSLFDTAVIIATFGKLTATDIPIPAGADFIRVNYIGTGLALGAGPRVKASFQ